MHPEIEFFLLKPGPDDGSAPIPADNGGYFDQAVHDSAPNFRRHAIDALESMGISVEFSHHEGAPGQQEIDLRFADALSMADNVMTFRYVDQGSRARRTACGRRSCPSRSASTRARRCTPT